MAKEQNTEEESINGFISNFMIGKKVTSNDTLTTDSATIPKTKANKQKKPDLQITSPSIVSTSSSSSASERSQKISISSVHSSDDDDVNSSVVDSDSDCEGVSNRQKKLTECRVVTTGTRTIGQCDPVELRAPGLGNFVSGAGPLQNISNLVVSDSSHVNIGSKFVFEGGSNITLVVKDKSQSPSNGHSNGGFVATNDAECTRKFTDNVSDDTATQWDKVKSKLMGGHRKYLFLLCTFVVVAIICTSTVLMNLQSTTEQYLPGTHSLKHVTRDEWLAQPPSEDPTPLQMPVARVIISHSATDNCTTQAACTFRVRFIQTFHIESRQWSDIAYNFLAGGDGNVFDGRGWDAQGAHTKGYNVGSIGIAFIGTFNKMVPPERQLNAVKQLLDEGIRLGKLTKTYKLFGARQLSSTESPGAALFEIIKTWPNFSTDID